MAAPPLVPANWSSFPDEFRQRLGTTVGRQRTMVSDSELLIVAHEVPKADEVSRRGVLFWRDASGEWRCSNGDPGRIAITKHLDRYSSVLDDLEVQEQKAIKADDYPPLLETLAPIVRSGRNLLEALEEARKAIPQARELIDLRDRAYDISRQADLLYEDSKNSMDVAIVRRADEQAQATHRMMVASHRLNVLAAMFFPFATLGAVFGTTLTDNWSWAQTPFPFIGFIAFSALCGFVLTKFVARPG
jgi:hypothetical protein